MTLSVDDHSIIGETQRWVKQVVIGLNLCPFAHQPDQQNTIDYRLATSNHSPHCDAWLQDMQTAFLQACQDLIETPATQLETLLLITPQGLEDFDDYLDHLDWYQQLLEQAELEGELQLASFHPHYLFDGEDPDSISHATNRSPYPMFHLIREDRLALAIAQYPNADQIPQRNIQTLQQLNHAQRQRLGINPDISSMNE